MAVAETQFIATLVKLAANPVVRGVKSFFTADAPFVEKAAVDTGLEFTEQYENIERRLLEWVGDERLLGFIDEARDPINESLRTEIIESFVAHADFYFQPEEEAHRHATRVLEEFLRRLHDLLLKSEQAAAYQAQLNRSGLEQLDTKLDDLGEWTQAHDTQSLNLSDELVSLLEDRKFGTVKTLIEARLQKKNIENLERSRLLRAQGICQIELEQYEEAVQSCRRSALLKDAPSTKALLALALLGHDDEDEDAYGIVDALWPTHRNEHYVFVAYVRVCKDDAALLKQLADDLADELDAKQTRVMAEAFLHLGELEKAAKMCDRVFAAEPEQPSSLILSAVLRVVTYESAKPGRRASWEMSTAEAASLGQASQLVEDALQSVRCHETPLTYRRAFILKAHLAGICGNYEAGIDAAIKLKNAFPDRPSGWVFHGRFLQESGAFEKAEVVLRSGLRDHDSDEIRWELAQCLRKLQKFDEVPELVLPLVEQDSWGHTADAFDAGLVSLRVLKRTEEADELALRLAERRTEGVGFMLVYALDFVRQGRAHEGARILRDAETVFTAEFLPTLRLERGRMEYWSGSYEEAAFCLREAVQSGADAVITFMYADALRQVGRAQEAREAAEKFLQEQGYDLDLAQFKADIEWEVNDLSSSLETWRMIERAESDDDLKPKLNILQFLMHDSQLGEARELARQCIPLARDAEPGDRIQLAHVLARLEHPEALEVGYEVFHEFPNNDEIAAKFLRLRVLVPDEDVKITEVQDGTEVVLRGPHGKETCVLDSGIDRPRFADELAPDSALWKALMGLSQGDSFRLSNDESAPEFCVEKIHPRYVSAFSRAVRALTTKFADKGHVQIATPEPHHGDSSRLDKRAYSVAQFVANYQAGHWPLFHTARLLGSSATRFWLTLAGDDPDRWLYGSRGTKAETSQELEVVEKAPAIVLTTLGFLAVAALGLFDAITVRFERVIGSRQIIEDLRAARELDVQLARVGHLHRLCDYYIFDELSDEEFDSLDTLLRELGSTARAQMELAPVWGRAGLDDEQCELVNKLDALVGRAAVDAGLLADEHDAVILDDDVRSKEEISAAFEVPTMSLQTLLVHLRRKELLSRDEHFQRLELLVQARYQYIRINVDFLRWLARRPIESRSSLSVALNYLSAPRCDERSAVRIAAKFIKQVWIGRYSPQRRFMILDETLSVLASHGPAAVQRFAETLPGLFGELLQLQLAEVLEAVGQLSPHLEYRD